MNIILSILVLCSLFVIRAMFTIDTEKHKYLFFIIPFGIMGFAYCRPLFDNVSSFLVVYNVFVFFSALPLMIFMSRINKFRLRQSNELKDKLHKAIKLDYWIRPIVYIGYLVFQMLIIWKGGEFIFIK